MHPSGVHAIISHPSATPSAHPNYRLIGYSAALAPIFHPSEMSSGGGSTFTLGHPTASHLKQHWLWTMHQQCLRSNNASRARSSITFEATLVLQHAAASLSKKQWLKSIAFDAIVRCKEGGNENPGNKRESITSLEIQFQGMNSNENQ